MTFDLKNFDSYREDNRLEVKKAKGGLPNSLWDTYSSMCNTYGGCIILGVEELPDHSWRPTGLKDVSKLKKDLFDTLNNPKKISINLIKEAEVRNYDVNGNVILVIPVPRATRDIKPVYINDNMMGGTFKRNWEGDYHCTPREVKAMLREQAEESPDMLPLENKNIADLNKDTIAAYRIRYNAKHPDGAWTKLSEEEFLIRIGAASNETSDHQIHPTGAGLLMFGEEYLITPQYPEYFLDFREKLEAGIRWTDRVQTNDGEWSGNAFDFFTKVYKKVTADFRVPFMTEGNGSPYRTEETPKHLAVREAIANCLANADFFQRGGVIIERYPDRIELSNPGTIILGKEQMIRGGLSEPRNKNILKMFNLIGIGEHAGSGVPEIFEAWRNEKLEDPIIEESFGTEIGDRTKVTMPLIPIKTTTTNIGISITTAYTAIGINAEQLHELMKFCQEPKSKAEMMEFLNATSRSTFERKVLKPLLKLEQLYRTDPDNPTNPKQKYYSRKHD